MIVSVAWLSTFSIISDIVEVQLSNKADPCSKIDFMNAVYIVNVVDLGTLRASCLRRVTLPTASFSNMGIPCHLLI